MELNRLLRITRYASISTHDAVYIIGGETGAYDIISTIAKYQNGWSHVNDLKTKRVGANAIQYNGKIMVIGGINGEWDDGQESNPP